MAGHSHPSAPDPPVLIIGAGITGLALARGLKNEHVSFKVFERDPELNIRGARDWAIACHWSSPILAKLVGEQQWSRIAEAQTDPNAPTKEKDFAPVINGKTGEILNRLPFINFYRFLRSRLRAFLAEGIDVTYGKKLSQITYSEDGLTATVFFDDGSSEIGRLVVGTDGSQSRVRNLTLSSEHAKVKRLPLAATFVNASFNREQALFLRSFHPLATAIIHPDNMMGMVALLDATDNDKPESWRFTFYISWQMSPEEQDAESATMGVKDRLKQLKEKSLSFADPLRSAVEWTPDNAQTVYWGGVAHWDPSLEEHTWDNHGGLVTLAGDAAHPMSYHRGQGLNHALDDVGKLTELLSRTNEKGQRSVIDEYQAEMRARAGEEVRLSAMNSVMLHDWSKVLQSPLLSQGLAKGEAKETPT